MWCAYYNPKNVDEDEIYKVDKKVDKNKVDKVWRTIDDTNLRPPYNRITLKVAHHCSTDMTWRCETYCIKIFGSALFDDEAEACLLLLSTKKVVCHWNTLVPIVLPAVLLRHQDMKNVDKDLHITYFFAGWCGVWCMRAPAPWIAANKHYQGIDDLLDTLVLGIDWDEIKDDIIARRFVNCGKETYSNLEIEATVSLSANSALDPSTVIMICYVE